MRIVAFTGPKGSGKDTAARYLLARNSLSGKNLFQQMNFAEPLKTVCKAAFGFTEAELNDPLLKEKMIDRYPYKTPREVMQHVANTFRTLYGGDIWVRRWVGRLDEVSSTQCIVVTDLRHPEELDMLKEYQAKIVFVENPKVQEEMRRAQLESKGDLPLGTDLNNLKAWNDPSESFYDLMRAEAHAVIVNNGTIQELGTKVHQAVLPLIGDWDSWFPAISK